MKIFVVNSGSSSIKFQLIDIFEKKVIAKGLCERIGLENSRLICSFKGEKKVINKDIKDHEEGIGLIIDRLTDKNEGVIRDKSEIYAIGHRVVHGGEKFSNTVITVGECSKY